MSLTTEGVKKLLVEDKGHTLLAYTFDFTKAQTEHFKFSYFLEEQKRHAMISLVRVLPLEDLNLYIRWKTVFVIIRKGGVVYESPIEFEGWTNRRDDLLLSVQQYPTYDKVDKRFG